MPRFLVFVFVLSLFGCDASGIAARTAPDDLEGLLDEEASGRLEQAVLRRSGEARLGLDGPWLSPTQGRTADAVGDGRRFHSPDPQAIALDEGVLLVAENRRVRLLIHPPEEDLLDVVRWEVRGGATADGAWGDSGEGVRFAPGRSVNITDTDEGFETVLASVDTWTLDAQAWVRADAVGKTYDRWDREERARGGYEAQIRVGADVFDAPDGALLGTVPKEREMDDWYGGCHLDGVRLIDRWGGWTRVELESEGLSVDGWLPASDVVERSGSTCFRCGGGWGRAVWKRSPHTLAAGTALRDAPDGRIVGVVLEDHGADLDEPDDNGWIATRVPTIWGIATVWIDSLDDFTPERAEPAW